MRTDETDPKTIESSAVLVHPETEIYVAPRSRPGKPPEAVDQQISMPSSPSSSHPSRKKKEQKTKAFKLSLIPPRIASQWGDLDVPQDELDISGPDRLMVCSSDTLDRIRSKNGDTGSGPLWVRVDLDITAGIDTSSVDLQAPDVEEEGKLGMDAWLVQWDEMPDGCIAPLGMVDSEWHEHGQVQYG